MGELAGIMMICMVFATMVIIGMAHPISMVFLCIFIIISIVGFLIIKRKQDKKIKESEKLVKQTKFRKECLEEFIETLTSDTKEFYFDNIKRKEHFLNKTRFHIEIVCGTKNLLEDFAIEVGNIGKVSKKTNDNFNKMLKEYSILLDKEIEKYEEEEREKLDKDQKFIDKQANKITNTFESMNTDIKDIV